ncbi:MAG: hypothetical protein ACXWCY_05720 [Burkholderiales bacterium]
MANPTPKPTLDMPPGWWAYNLDDIDQEIARLATLCQVKVLEPGVIERVLHKDESACGTSNALAFRKLHDMLMLHFAIRQKAADAIGQTQTGEIERYIVERLKKAFPVLAQEGPRT